MGNNSNQLIQQILSWAGFVLAILSVVLYFVGPVEAFETKYPLLYSISVNAPYVTPWLLVILFGLLYWSSRNTRKWRDIEKVTGLVKYVPKLEGSGYHPHEMRANVKSSLDFMGNGASKWTTNSEKLENMLKELKYRKSKARFLITNPLSIVYGDGQNEVIKEYKKKVAKSIRTFCELQKTYPDELEVKVYEHIPQFRLTFYKDSVAVGHYRGPEKKDSRDTPLLIFQLECDWSFYKALEFHFDVEWASATGIGDLDKAAIDALIDS